MHSCELEHLQHLVCHRHSPSTISSHTPLPYPPSSNANTGLHRILAGQKLATEKGAKKGHAATIQARKAAARHGTSVAGGGGSSSTVAGSVLADDEEMMMDGDGNENENGGMNVEGETGAAAAAGGRSRASSKASKHAANAAAASSGSAASMAVDDAAASSAAAGPTDIADVLGAGWVSPGQYITLHISGVPADAVKDLLGMLTSSSSTSSSADASSAAGTSSTNVTSNVGSSSAGVVSSVPLTIWGLLRHENRTSIVHYNLTRMTTYDQPLKNKEQLEFHAGPGRLFDARPLFSSSTPAAPRGKMERYLLPGRSTTATLYGPIVFAPCPVMVFKRVPIGPTAAAAAAGNTSSSSSSSGSAAMYPSVDRLSVDAAGRTTRLVLVATGTVSTADPDRIILKRTILSGFPVKVRGCVRVTLCCCVVVLPCACHQC